VLTKRLTRTAGAWLEHLDRQGLIEESPGPTGTRVNNPDYHQRQIVWSGPETGGCQLRVHPEPTGQRRAIITEACCDAQLSFDDMVCSSEGGPQGPPLAANRVLVEKHASALVVGVSAFFNTHREKLIALAARHAVPTVYFRRDFIAVESGLDDVKTGG
jgi:hypothetical protein